MPRQEAPFMSSFTSALYKPAFKHAPLPASPSADSMFVLCSVLVCLHRWLHSLFVNIPFFLSGFYFLYFLKCYLLKVRVQPSMVGITWGHEACKGVIPNYLRRGFLLSFDVEYELETNFCSIKSLGFGRAVSYYPVILCSSVLHCIRIPMRV